MHFLAWKLSSYNHKFKDVLIDCKCYILYSTIDAFVENVIEKRISYMACLSYQSAERKRINHTSIPVMIGSYLDYRIRGLLAIEDCRCLWGSFIYKGVATVYANFSTFDALSMHVRQTKHAKSIDWFTYIDMDGLELNYCNKKVTWIYQRKKNVNNDWVILLEKANPFGTKVILSDYIEMFDIILQYPYCMNDLSNRRFLTGPAMLEKYVEHDKKRRLQKKTVSQNLRSALEDTRTLYNVLGKNNAVENKNWASGKCQQSLSSTLHEGKSNLTEDIDPTSVRATNATILNSPATSCPSDALNFFDLTNVRDLKAAGAQNVFADFTIMSEETNELSLFNYIKNNIAQKNGDHILTINGFLIDCRCSWNLKILISIKAIFPHVTTQYHLPYIRFSTRANILIKYSDQHDTYFSPAETTHFQIQYPTADMYSITTKRIPPEGILLNPSSKTTVAINNMKGSIAILNYNPTNKTGLFHKLIMENSFGITAYMIITQDQIESLPNYATLSYNNNTDTYNKYYSKLNVAFKLTGNINQHLTTTNIGKAMKSLLRLHPPAELLFECLKSSNTPFVKKKNLESNKYVGEYMSSILGSKNYKPPNLWNLKLNVVFGNPRGFCIEDGVVIDSNILQHIPPIYYNACITVEFTFDNVKNPKESRFIQVDISKNSMTPNDMLIGCLVTRHELLVKKSRHVNITLFKIGSHNFHLISFSPIKTNMYDNLKIRPIYNNKSISIVITGQKKVRLGVGCKIANAFGQKNVISQAIDLKGCSGITKDGREIHAQLVYSEVSVISRLLCGQFYHMFNSKDLAFREDGTFIAPLYTIIHYLNPTANEKVFTVKIDTLTRNNGFMLQNLSAACDYLRTDDYKTLYSRVVQVIGFHGFDVRFIKETNNNYCITHHENNSSDKLNKAKRRRLT